MISPKTAEVNVRKSVIESSWTMEVNTKELKVFLATNMDIDDIKSENFEEVIPRRRSNKGISPTIVGKEMNARPKPKGSEAFVIQPNVAKESITNKKSKRNTIKDDHDMDTVDQELIIELDNKKMDLNILKTKSVNKLRHLSIKEIKKNKDLDGLKSFSGSSDLSLRKKVLLKEMHKDLAKRDSEVDKLKDGLTRVSTNQIDPSVDATNIKEDNDDTRKKIKISSWAKAQREPTETEIKLMVGWMMGIADS